MKAFNHKTSEFKEKPYLLFMAWAVSFALGVFFIFLWSPLPPRKLAMGGYDEYQNLALLLADGNSYPTMERIWGYPYFLSHDLSFIW